MSVAAAVQGHLSRNHRVSLFTLIHMLTIHPDLGVQAYQNPEDAYNWILNPGNGWIMSLAIGPRSYSSNQTAQRTETILTTRTYHCEVMIYRPDDSTYKPEAEEFDSAGVGGNVSILRLAEILDFLRQQEGTTTP